MSILAKTLLATVALVAGCSHGPTHEEVVLRLDDRHFGNPQALPHTPVVRVGRVVRSIPFPRRPVFSTSIPLATVRDGRVRATVTMPPKVAALPPSAFTLSDLLGSPAGGTTRPDDNAAPGFRGNAVRLERHWRLGRSPRVPGVVKIAAALSRSRDDLPVILELQAVSPMPPRLESAPFDLPDGATLALGYGLAHPTRASHEATVCFSATLRCAWRWPRTLVSHCLHAADEGIGQWHDAERFVRWGGRACRLVLATRADGPDAGDAAWSVPLVRAAVPDDPRRDLNVVLVSLDTLGAAHLSGYGYDRPTSPSFDRLVMGGGVTFTDASTTYPMTNVAHLGIFTGLYPGGLPGNGILPGEAAIPTLAEILRDAGLTTIGFTEDGLVSMEYGFGWGFDELTEYHPEPALRAREVFSRGREFLKQNAHRRFFLFLHTYEVHSPYSPSPAYAALYPDASPDHDPSRIPIPERYRADRDAYDRSIRELDDRLADFVTDLGASGLAGRTLLVVLSDHGEAFGEHGITGHGPSPHQEALHVPLVFHVPGARPGLRVATPVSLVDVAPTILDLLGLPVPEIMQGRSLRRAIAGEPIAPRPLFFEWLGKGCRGVRLENWKIVRNRFGTIAKDLSADPLEQQTRDERPAPRVELARVLDGYDAESTRRRARIDVAAQPPSIAPDVAQALRALGYVK